MPLPTPLLPRWQGRVDCMLWYALSRKTCECVGELLRFFVLNWTHFSAASKSSLIHIQLTYFFYYYYFKIKGSTSHTFVFPVDLSLLPVVFFSVQGEDWRPSSLRAAHIISQKVASCFRSGLPHITSTEGKAQPAHDLTVLRVNIWAESF